MNRQQSIAGAPAEQQAVLRQLALAIRKAFPAATPDTTSCSPIQVMDGHWPAGHATRKKGAMFYCMDRPLLDEDADRPGQRRSGNTCAECRPVRGLTVEDLHALVPEIHPRQAGRHARGEGGFVNPYSAMLEAGRGRTRDLWKLGVAELPLPEDLQELDEERVATRQLEDPRHHELRQAA
jgi:hypothetical protein